MVNVVSYGTEGRFFGNANFEKAPNMTPVEMLKFVEEDMLCFYFVEEKKPEEKEEPLFEEDDNQFGRSASELVKHELGKSESLKKDNPTVTFINHILNNKDVANREEILQAILGIFRQNLVNHQRQLAFNELF